jgi:hypothetical protein
MDVTRMGKDSHSYYPVTWEQVDRDTYRIPTPFGWLVTNNEGISLCYVPDERHHWRLLKAEVPVNE